MLRVQVRLAHFRPSRAAAVCECAWDQALDRADWHKPETTKDIVAAMSAFQVAARAARECSQPMALTALLYVTSLTHKER